VIPVGFIFQLFYKPRFVDVGIISQRYVPEVRVAVGQAFECFCSHDVSIYIKATRKGSIFFIKLVRQSELLPDNYGTPCEYDAAADNYSPLYLPSIFFAQIIFFPYDFLPFFFIFVRRQSGQCNFNFHGQKYKFIP
jgi:hypothetical protein